MTDAATERAIRAHVDAWVIAETANPPTLHAPSPDADEAAPRCLTGLGNGVTTAGNWREKSLAVYPVGYHDVCRRCCDHLRRAGVLEAEA